MSFEPEDQEGDDVPQQEIPDTMSESHPGFKAVQSAVAHNLSKKHGMSPEAAHEHAGRIIGYAKAHASKAAKRANPNLMNT